MSQPGDCVPVNRTGAEQVEPTFLDDVRKRAAEEKQRAHGKTKAKHEQTPTVLYVEKNHTPVREQVEKLVRRAAREGRTECHIVYNTMNIVAHNTLMNMIIHELGLTLVEKTQHDDHVNPTEKRPKGLAATRWWGMYTVNW